MHKRDRYHFKWKRAALFLTVFVAALGMSACKKEEKKEPLTAKDDPKEVLQAANEQYGKETRRGSLGTYVYTYADGSTEEETADVSFDTKKGVEQLVYMSGEEESGRIFHVKDKDAYYTYALDMETNAWIRYEQEPDEDGETTYETQEKGFSYVYDEASGYTDVEYSNEGEETLDGRTAIKILITGAMENASEDETEAVTRESILADYEITEEAIGYIDGMSEALDKYVDAMNASGDEEPDTFEASVWVEADTHRPLKSGTVIDTGAESKASASEDISAFEDNLWKVYNLMNDMDEGLSAAEALENIKKQEPEMEAELQAEKEMMEEEGLENGENDTMEEKTVTLTEEKVYGDDCTEIDELPEHYTEITQDEYFNGEY